MSCIDFFRFLTVQANEEGLFNTANVDIASHLKQLQNPDIKHMGIALFDSHILQRPQQVQDIKQASINDAFSFYFMPDIRCKQAKQQIEQAASMGCKAIVFHPYLQKIMAEDDALIRQLALHTQHLGLFINICCAYGSPALFDIKPLHSVLNIAKTVQCPIVITHAGGAKICDALLLAESFPHLLLDTSFSLPYWMESPIEAWFAFSIKKLGSTRWMFASDAPFINQQQALSTHQLFFAKHQFSKTQIDDVMSNTAATLLQVAS